jgi:acetoacetyl-CoA reductase
MAQRVALVTGGMGGLGEAICIKLAALGYKVVTTHSPGNAKAPEWLDAMKKLGYSFTPIRATSRTTRMPRPA